MTQRVVIEGYVDWTFEDGEKFDIKNLHNHLHEFLSDGNFVINVYEDHEIVESVDYDNGEIVNYMKV